MPRLIEMLHETGSKQQIAGFQYGYDKEHHRLFEKRLHQTNKGDVYAYDSIYRVQDNKQNVDLTSVAAGQEIKPETFSSSDRLQYTYDGVGNRKQVTATVANVSTTTAYTLGVANQYAQIKTGNQAAQNLKYDNNWNLISDGRREYSYDLHNRIVEVRDQLTKSVIVRYSYDAPGRRAMKVVDPNGSTPKTTIYVFDGHQVIEERDDKDAVTRQHVWGNGVDELCQQKIGTQSSQAFYAHENSIGSIAALVDGTGKVVERYDYDPFGNTTLTLDGKTGNEYRFHAARSDPETGLYYMRARYYSPEMGRFQQRDPIGGWLDSVNLGNAYSLGGSDTVNARDPLGLASWAGFFQGSLDVLRGVGDALTFGQSAKLRRHFHGRRGEVLNQAAYVSGMVAGTAGSIAVGVGASNIGRLAHAYNALGTGIGVHDAARATRELMRGCGGFQNYLGLLGFAPVAGWVVGRGVTGLNRARSSGLMGHFDDIADGSPFPGHLEGVDEVFHDHLHQLFEQQGAGLFRGFKGPGSHGKATQFDPDELWIYFERDKHVATRVVGEEVQHAIDFAHGARDPDAIFEIGAAATGTRDADLVNKWWHRRVFTRLLQNIDQGNHGLGALRGSMDDIYSAYESIGGSLKLDEILTTQFNGLY